MKLMNDSLKYTLKVDEEGSKLNIWSKVHQELYYFFHDTCF